MWQRYRDEAQWALTSVENTLSRAHAAAVAGMNQDFQREMYKDKYKDYVAAQNVRAAWRFAQALLAVLPTSGDCTVLFGRLFRCDAGNITVNSGR